MINLLLTPVMRTLSLLTLLLSLTACGTKTPLQLPSAQSSLGTKRHTYAAGYNGQPADKITAYATAPCALAAGKA